jgi:hypothetical protein
MSEPIQSDIPKTLGTPGCENPPVILGHQRYFISPRSMDLVENILQEYPFIQQIFKKISIGLQCCISQINEYSPDLLSCVHWIYTDYPSPMCLTTSGDSDCTSVSSGYME